MADENPNTPDEKPPVDPKDKQIAELKDETIRHRKAAKTAKDEVSALSEKLSGVLAAFGVEKPEDLPSLIDEYRASREEVSKDPSLDPKVLLKDKQKLEKDFGMTKKERDAFLAERDQWKGRYETSMIDLALQSALAAYQIKPGQVKILAKGLRENLKLNEQHQPVWIVRDSNGEPWDETTVPEGVKSYLEANTDWLPATAPEGTGKKEDAPAALGKPVTRDSFKDINSYLKQREKMPGVKPLKPIR